MRSPSGPATAASISVAKLDEHQVLAYDLAHAAAAVEGSRVMCAYGEHGEVESLLARAYVADAVADLADAAARPRRSVGRRRPTRCAGAMQFVAEHRSPAFLEPLGDQCAKHGTGPTHLSDDFELVAETFRRFAEDKIRPVAEHVHRTNADVPEDIIAGLAEIGGFGLSVPEEYGGFATGGESDYLGMVVATEELSRGSLGIGGSLVTRPEILTRALVAGGTEEQKQRLAAAHRERRADGRDHGDRARLRIRRRGREGHGDARRRRVARQRREDVGDVRGPRRRAHAARRAPTPTGRRATAACRCSSSRSRKPRATRSRSTTGGGGKIDGRAIDTIGYRGMHSYEVAFDNWFVPAENLIGGEGGLGRGFYLQMAGFENGRLQTAARAVGLDAGRVRGRDVVRAGPQGVRQRRCSTTSSRRRSSPAWPPSSRPVASSPTTWREDGRG